MLQGVSGNNVDLTSDFLYMHLYFVKRKR